MNLIIRTTLVCQQGANRDSDDATDEAEVVSDTKDTYWNIDNNDAWHIRAGGVDALESPIHGALLTATIGPLPLSRRRDFVELAELRGVSKNPRGYSDPNSEAEHLQKIPVKTAMAADK